MALECSLFHSHTSREKNRGNFSCSRGATSFMNRHAACCLQLHATLPPDQHHQNCWRVLFFYSLGSAHIHTHSSCCSCSKAQAHTHTHNINRRFALFLLPVWLFITTGRQPLFEKSCRQQEYRLLERKEEESFIRARMTRRMWLLSLTNQLGRLVETRVETDVLHHNAVFLELVMLRPAGAGSRTLLDTRTGYCWVERHKSPQTAPAMWDDALFLSWTIISNLQFNSCLSVTIITHTLAHVIALKHLCSFLRVKLLL